MQTRHLGVVILSFVALPFWAAEPSPSVTGIENFHQVNQFVYRGAQPSNEGFR